MGIRYFPTALSGAMNCRRFEPTGATAADVFAAYPAASRIACLTARDIRNAGCIIDTNEPPRGHVCIYREDRPGQRIGGQQGRSCSYRRPSPRASVAFFRVPRPGVEPGLEVPETSVMSFSLPGQCIESAVSIAGSSETAPIAPLEW
jgi:hypothetical protein